MNVNNYLQNRLSLLSIDNKETKNKNSITENKGLSFLDTLKEKLDAVNDKQIAADENTLKFIKGDDVDVHEVMISTEEAKLSLEMAVQVRNKLVEAYQELNRMQL